EHELGKYVACGGAVLRIGGEFAVESHQAAGVPGGVAEHVDVFELEAGFQAVVSSRAEEHVVELGDEDVVGVGPEGARAYLSVALRVEKREAVIVGGGEVGLGNSGDAELVEERFAI